VAITHLSNQDFNQNEIQNAVLQPLGSAPSSPVLGQFYLNTAGGLNLWTWWNGSAWVIAPRLDQIPAPSAPVALNSQQITGLADPSGAQHAATQNYVLGRKVTDLTAPTAPFSMNSQKITNVGTATTAGDATDYTFVTNAVEAARQGLTLKNPVATAIGTNVTIASPGATINGVTMATNDRFLAYGQTTGSENGIYVWNGAATPATRAVDADVFGELQDGTQTWAMAGTANGNVQFRQTATLTSFTGQTWIPVAAGTTYTFTSPLVDTSGTVTLSTAVPRSYSTNFGDGSATSYVITHNLGTRAVNVTVFRNSTPWDEVQCDNERTSTNTVTLRPSVAPTTDQFTVVVSG
jgi:uncharacterized Zn-binding protein involved in type VI secretion